MIRLGITGCAEIAFRRFMPAVMQVEGIKPVAVAEEYSPDKLTLFGVSGEVLLYDAAGFSKTNSASRDLRVLMSLSHAMTSMRFISRSHPHFTKRKKKRHWNQASTF